MRNSSPPPDVHARTRIALGFQLAETRPNDPSPRSGAAFHVRAPAVSTRIHAGSRESPRVVRRSIGDRCGRVSRGRSFFLSVFRRSRNSRGSPSALSHVKSNAPERVRIRGQGPQKGHFGTPKPQNRRFSCTFELPVT